VPGAGTHALLTRAPLGPGPKPRTPFDLHVLSAPPAFVLSQDQTLSFILVTASSDPAWHPQSLPDHDPKFGPPSPRAITSRDAAPDLAVQANAPSKADKPPDPDHHARARGPPLPKNAHGPTTTSPPPTHPFLFTTLSKDQPHDREGDSLRCLAALPGRREGLYSHCCRTSQALFPDNFVS
jgi:hypothetical protein